MLAWRAHSSPQSRQAVSQAVSICRITSSFDPVRRDATAPVAAQKSAQSRLSRMHYVSFWTVCSPRHASAQEVQVWAQS